jgi:CubicO group peptidase (beta-lactamase class C family)
VPRDEVTEGSLPRAAPIAADRRADVVEIGGAVAPGFQRVVEEFERNFVERGDVGAAFAAVRDGDVLVDIWGGVADADSGRPWTRDTLQIIFSGTKGLVAACVLLLLDRGTLDLDRPLAHYWPEFAAAGKEDVLVRDAVAHTVGLPGLDIPVTWQQATDDVRMAALVAAQPRSTDPRAARTYHALTYGWICGELVRRVTEMSVGRFFDEEIARPRRLEIWLGLPEELEPRVSRVSVAPGWGAAGALSAQRLAADPLLRSIANPVRYDPQSSFPWNERLWHAAEVPGANAIGAARSIAAMYGDIETLLSPATLELAQQPLSSRLDALVSKPMSFGVGFQLQTEELQFGPPADAFGHGGAGGSCHGFWPTQRVGFSYSMNLLRDDSDDVRARRLLETLYECVEQAACG